MLNRYKAVGTKRKKDRGGKDAGTTDTPRAPLNSKWDQMFRTAIDLSDAGAHVCAQVVPDALHSEAYWEKRIPQFMDYLLG